jgi:hypothetical protein
MTDPEIARDGGPFNIREAKAALDFHIAKATHRGDYGAVSDLQAIADVIDRLVEDHDRLASQLASLAGAALEVRASLETLGKEPQ